MSIQEELLKMKDIHQATLSFIDAEGNNEENFCILIDILKKYEIKEDKHLCRLFLKSILAISNNHIRITNFFDKIFQILIFLEDHITKSFTNSELFYLFMQNKRIILFFIERKMLSIDGSVYKIIKQFNRSEQFVYMNYFYHEIKELFADCSNIEEYEKKLPENLKEKRRIGENDNYICEIIRNDLIEDFIIYVNKECIPLSSEIKVSFFETNKLLLEKQPSLIEYAAFFGSVQIFKYLYLNNVQMESSLWIYAIHSNNQEIIELLIENQVKPKDLSYYKCLKESIKCHHNDLAFYIKENYMNHDFDEQLIRDCFHYYNFIFVKNDVIPEFIFFYACEYDYFKIVDFMIKNQNVDINKTMREKNKKNEEFDVSPLHLAAKNNNNEIINLLMTQNKIYINNKTFYNCSKLTQIKLPQTILKLDFSMFFRCYMLREIVIPSSVVKIAQSCFACCYSLEKIIIPSSVKSIGKEAFSKCKSLKEITLPPINKIKRRLFEFCTSLTHISIPSTVTFIDDSFESCVSLKTVIIESSLVNYICGFYRCTSLTEINLPDSVEHIGNCTFDKCFSLKTINIPSKVDFIGRYSFYQCKSLEYISIPSNVNFLGEGVFDSCSSLKKVFFDNNLCLTKIDAYTFNECISLSDINIPQSVEIIGDNAFQHCTSLKNIILPNSLKYIYGKTFKLCSSLEEISIPSSVSGIGSFSFEECTSLKKISISTSLISINERLFKGCTLLNQILIPSSVIKIEEKAFENCSNLETVMIPCSVKKIKSNIFIGCSSLKQLYIPYTLKSVNLEIDSKVDVKYYNRFQEGEIFI